MTPKSDRSAFRELWIFWGTGLLVFVLDQLTKLVVELHPLLPSPSHPDWGSGITVIPNFFYLVHVGNPGAAWGMFSGFGLALALLAVVALLAIWFFRKSIGLYQKINQLAVGMIAGGILGNLLDRIVRGEVVDFLLFRFGNWDYPVFNVADSGICLGVIVYIVANWNSNNS